MVEMGHTNACPQRTQGIQVHPYTLSPAWWQGNRWAEAWVDGQEKSHSRVPNAGPRGETGQKAKHWVLLETLGPPEKCEAPHRGLAWGAQRHLGAVHCRSLLDSEASTQSKPYKETYKDSWKAQVKPRAASPMPRSGCHHPPIAWNVPSHCVPQEWIHHPHFWCFFLQNTYDYGTR